jgi:hypothetical protein
VPITVVLELEWVLRGAYRLERGVVIAALEALMAIRRWPGITKASTSPMPCTSCAVRMPTLSPAD